MLDVTKYPFLQKQLRGNSIGSSIIYVQDCASLHKNLKSIPHHTVHMCACRKTSVHVVMALICSYVTLIKQIVPPTLACHAQLRSPAVQMLSPRSWDSTRVPS